MANDKKKPATTDPLEAAKIATKPPPPPPPPPEPEPKLHLPIPGAVEPPRPAPKQYRVAATTTVSINGQLVKLVQGDAVTEAEYGPRGVAQILAANVALVEI